jgi:hypothetical protein
MIGQDLLLTAPDGRRLVAQTDVGSGRMKRAEAIAADVLAKHPTATRMHVVSFASRDQEYAVVWEPGAPPYRVRVTLPA